jgi:Na+-driven multidrug efflux pump
LFFFLKRQEPPVRVEFHKFAIHGSLLKRMLRIGVPAGLQNAVFSLSNVIIQSAINSLGSDIMAASSAAFNIEILAYFIINSFGQACTTFVGQNYGAQKNDRCRQVTRVALLWDLAITAALSVALIGFGSTLLSLFNRDPVIIEYGKIRLWYILAFEVINVFMEVFSGSMRGYGHSTEPAVITFVGVCGIRIAWVFTIFAASPKFDTLMMVYPVSWIVTAGALGVAYLIILHKKNGAAI